MTTSHIWQMLADTGLTNERIAEYLGCHPNYLADMRKANVPVSGPMRAKLAELLGITEEELFGEYLREIAAMKGKE